MSPRTKRPLPTGPYYLTNDLERPHGPRVNVCDGAGRELGWLDRPLAEFLVEALEKRERAA